MKTGSQVHEKTIGPGETAFIDQDADFFWILESPVTLQVRVKGGSFNPYVQDTGEDYGRVGSFTRLDVRNPSLNTVRVLIYVGYSRFISSRSSVIEPNTKFIAWNGTQIGATSGETFTGVPPAGSLRRKAIQVTNEDATLRLHLRDADGNVGLIIFPETSITLPISESVQVFNPNGAAVAARVSEIYWQQA